MSPGWQAAIGYALVGEEFHLDEPGRPDPEALAASLATLGWTGERVRDLALTRAASGLPWPHPVPPQLRQGCGAAQLSAALAATRAALGITTLDTRPPSGRTALTPDEVRLLREVPPHHGS